MKIAVLDKSVIDPNTQLDFSKLYELGEVVEYQTIAPQDIIAVTQDVDIIITNKIVLDATVDKEFGLRIPSSELYGKTLGVVGIRATIYR